MSADLRITVHGPFRLSASCPLPALSRRAQAMLAFLSQQPQMRAERAEIADLLWSDRPEEQARASLRQELSVLRRALPDGLLTANRQSIALDETRCEVDSTGQGVFMQGFDLPSEGFEDWLRTIRNRPAGATEASPARARPVTRPRPGLVVLPFEEIGSAEDDMFADGIVEEITGALSRVHDFHVIARQTALALGRQAGQSTAAERLDVDYIVEGSVRRAGERVRIAVHLIAAADGRTLWSERFDDRLDDLFDLQDRIAAQVAGQISPNLRNAEIERARSRPPTDRTAYDLTLLAYPKFWTLEQADSRDALRLVSEAIERDPEFAPALGLKAWLMAHQVTYMWSRNPREDRAEAMDLAVRAARHAGDHVPTLVAIGATCAQAGVDMALARHHIDTALRLDPNSAWAWLRRGWLHQYRAETPEALAAFDRAEELSPLDPFLHQIHFGRAATLYRWGDQTEKGIRMIEEGLRLYPGVHWPLRMLAVAYARQGRLEEARDAVTRLRTRLPHVTLAYLQACLPPLASLDRDNYIGTLRQAGFPEA
ncbi:tetratricopeptide repeat protein [Algicella marina]|uniref:Tetratricopeptide repeat protein n=1 Tax=Algicella marina TaxID=2683284 RepID=A0A6P1SZ83_9RHOB|nr:tetratricopeptide repeat protein [Algicella marina]QHQ35057.1 tetratricopeptide repeat protein [Algicella marina]